MDSYKGYGKLNRSSVEDQSLPSHKPNRKFLLAAVSLFLLLTVVIGAMVGLLLINKSTSKPPEAQSSPSDTSESIRAVCSVTQYPEPCFDSISSVYNSVGLSKPDPELIFNLSLAASANELKSLLSVPETLMSKSKDARTVSALKDCVSLFDDAMSQVNKSVEVMAVGAGEKVLTEEKIGDMKSWISAAMTDEETCLDGLEEMESTVTDEMRGKVQKSKEYMSNSLAILANIQVLLDKFNLTMH